MLELAREVAVEVRGPDTARALLPPGRGRGSSVSSIVCYLTGLSHVDPIANELFLGRFLNEEITALPDIDLDFPRDVRERADPARPRALRARALGARRRLPDLPRARRDPRAGQGARACRRGRSSASRAARRAGRRATSAGHRHRARAERLERDGPAGRWRWLARAGRRGPRPAAPPLPALRRDDRRHPAAGRLLPRRARRDGGPADRAVGQGLLRRRGLPEDRPARPGDALGGRALRRADRRARAASGSTSRGSPTTTPRPTRRSSRPRRPASSRSRAARRWPRCVRTRPENLDDLTIQVAIVRPGPIQGGAVNPYIERRQRLRADPDYEVPYDHPSLEPVLRDTLGTIIFQDQVIEVAMAFAGFSPGEAEGLRRAMSRKRSAAAIEAHHQRFVEGAVRAHGADVDEALAERVFDDDRRLLRLRLPQGPRRRVRPARLPVDLAARALRPGVPVRAARRAADGLLPARRARPRGAAPRHRGARRRTSTPAPSACTVDGRRARSGSGSATCSACAATRWRRSSPRASPAGRSARSTTSPRARAPGGRRSTRLAWSGAATRWPARRRRRRYARAARRCGGWASPRRPSRGARHGHAARARRSTCPPRPRCDPLRRLGRDARRLRDDRADDRRRTRSALLRARAAARGAVDERRPRRRSPTARRCASAGSSSPASGRGRRTGSCFMLLEDEHGTINLVVPPDGLRAPPPDRPDRAAGRSPRACSSATPPAGGGDQRARRAA